jgi:hypothetical protein
MNVEFSREKRLIHGQKVVVLGTFQIGRIKRIWSSNLYDVGTADVLIGRSYGVKR